MQKRFEVGNHVKLEADPTGYEFIVAKVVDDAYLHSGFDEGRGEAFYEIQNMSLEEGDKEYRVWHYDGELVIWAP